MWVKPMSVIALTIPSETRPCNVLKETVVDTPPDVGMSIWKMKTNNKFHPERSEKAVI